MPGSGTHGGTVDLFSSEDIRQANELNKINQAGKGSGKPKGKGMSLFGRGRPAHLTLPRTSTGGSWKFKKPGGFAMQGKGQGGQWFGQGALVSGQGGHASSSSFTEGYPSFTYPPRWGASKGGFKGKGGRGTKGVLPSATPPVMPFFQRLRQRMKWWRLHAPTTSAEAYTAWCALSVAPSPPPPCS